MGNNKKCARCGGTNAFYDVRAKYCDLCLGYTVSLPIKRCSKCLDPIMGKIENHQCCTPEITNLWRMIFKRDLGEDKR